MTIAEQIAALEATREEKAAQMNDIAQKSMDESRSMDDAEGQEFDQLESEVKRIDDDLARLRILERMQAAKAKPAEDQARAKAGASLDLGNPTRIRTDVKKAPGVAFAQYARCVALGHLHNQSPVEIAKTVYSDDQRIANLLQRAAVPAANTIDPTWAGNLVSDEGGVFADFVEFLRPQTILGRFGTGGVPNLRRVPFRTPLIGQTGGGQGYWVGEGKAKPLTQFSFDRRTIEPTKVANIAVATKELLRDSSPSADMIIRDSLADALRERLDLDFIDPAKAAAAGVSPASVLNGATNTASSGTDADAVRCDVQTLFDTFIAANNAPTSGVWIMSASQALALSLMVNPLGQPEFPGIGMTGGTFYGLPVIVSEYVPDGVVALVNAGDIYLADDGGIEVSMSTEASLQMDDAPTNASAPSGAVTPTTLVSLWQTNSVGFLAERTISWARRRDSSVAYLTGVAWTACVTS